MRIASITLAAAFATIIAVACFETPGPTEPLLPSCEITGPSFDFAPFDLEEIDRFEPMGGVAPPLHALPGDYVTARLRLEGDPPAPPTVQLRAPGDIRISLIVRRTRYNELNQPAGNDYSITFDTCRQVRFSIGRMTGLAPALLDAVGTWDRCADNGLQNSPGILVHFSFCVEEPDLDVSRGDAIGSAGGQPGQDALELRAWDARNAPTPFANPARYGASSSGFDVFHVNCFFDYFTSELRQPMFAKSTRSTEPRCGNVANDRVGTAQGNWFLSEAGPTSTNVSQQLSLVPYNVDPTRATIASAGSLTNLPVLIIVDPESSGTTNRHPEDIVDDEAIYCYGAPGGRILVKLESEVHLVAEFQSGSACGVGGAYSFGNSLVFTR